MSKMQSKIKSKRKTFLSKMFELNGQTKKAGTNTTKKRQKIKNKKVPKKPTKKIA